MEALASSAPAAPGSGFPSSFSTPCSSICLNVTPSTPGAPWFPRASRYASHVPHLPNMAVQSPESDDRALLFAAVSLSAFSVPALLSRSLSSPQCLTLSAESSVSRVPSQVRCLAGQRTPPALGGVPPHCRRVLYYYAPSGHPQGLRRRCRRLPSPRFPSGTRRASLVPYTSLLCVLSPFPRRDCVRFQSAFRSQFCLCQATRGSAPSAFHFRGLLRVHSLGPADSFPNLHPVCRGAPHLAFASMRPSHFVAQTLSTWRLSLPGLYRLFPRHSLGREVARYLRCGESLRPASFETVPVPQSSP